MGKRKYAITQGDIDKICNLIRSGNYVKTSVNAVGVNYNTFIQYMNRGKKGHEKYAPWYEQVEQAKAEFESGAVSKIAESGSDGNIGAYMWMLPRMYPQRWGKVNRQEVKVDNSQQITIKRYSDTVKNSDIEKDSE